MPKNKRYLGLDLSTKPGLAVIELRGKKPRLLDVTSFRTDRLKLDEGERFAYIESQLTRYYYEWRPFDTIVRERPGSSRNLHVTNALYGIRAISSSVFRGNCSDIVDVSPGTVKKVIGGHGKADKDEVMRGVLRWFPDAKFANDDESDAVAVILTWLIREKII